MRIHESMRPLPAAPEWIAASFETSVARDGGFSRVVPISAFSVLKMTCCRATEALLTELWEHTKRGEPIPEGLPAVLDYHGLVAEDDDGFVYSGWTLERLFDSPDDKALLAARALGRDEIGRVKSGYRKRLSRTPARKAGIDGLRDLMRRERHLHQSPHAVCQKKLAFHMALNTSNGLKDAFLYLSRFMQKQNSALDLLTQGNIMVNMFGDPVLGDPICENSYESAPADLLSQSGPFGGWAVTCKVPYSVQGLTVNVAPSSSLSLSREKAELLAERLEALGATPLVVQYGSIEHQRTMTSAAEEASVWSWKNVLDNLRNNAYERLLASYAEAYQAQQPDNAVVGHHG